MGLNYEMARYTELTGEDGTRVPIIQLGSFLDGYDKGFVDAINKCIDTVKIYDRNLYIIKELEEMRCNNE